MPFAGWRALDARAAAAELHRRVAALPEKLRHSAVSWLQDEAGLAREFARAPGPAPLRGVPYFAKDLYDVARVPTHAGSSFLARVRPTLGDSALVRRLRELGAAIAGKSHMVEFAAGLTGENRTYGDCPHPLFPDRLAGGSSSGSAALVAAGVVPFSLGSDTGGSVRVPAAFCGLYGFRMTPGDKFIADAFPLSPACDTAGWFTATPEDMRELCALLVPGFDAGKESTPRGVFLTAKDVLGGADADVDAACQAAAEKFATRADAAQRSALLESWGNAVDAYSTVVMTEAFAVHRKWLSPHRDEYDPGIWQRFNDAGKIPAEKVLAARGEFERVQKTFSDLFGTVDFIALPCAPVPAITKAQATPETRRAILTLTAPASVAGLPALTVPVPLPNGLTAGLQIIAPSVNSAVFGWVLKGRQSSTGVS